MQRPQGAGAVVAGQLGALPFSLADVEKALPAHALRLGLIYAEDGSVQRLQLSVDGRRLTAEVQGSRRRPYAVTILFPGRGRLQPSCTCPVSFACKHAAAVLLAALEAGTPAPADPLAGPVGLWLDGLATLSAPKPPAERILYVLHRGETGSRGEATVEVGVTRLLKAGGYGAMRRYEVSNLAYRSARCVTAEDALIGQLLSTRAYGYPSRLPSEPEQLQLAFTRMLATGRCHFEAKDTPPLALGPERPGRLGWRLETKGEQLPTAEAEAPGLVTLVCAAPWYVDVGAGQAGPLLFDQPATLVAAFLQAPAVTPEQGEALRARLKAAALPPPRASIPILRLSEPPVPWLTLTTERLQGWSASAGQALDLGLLAFDYGGTPIGPGSELKELRRVEEERIVVRRRDARAERACRDRLKALGLVPSPFTPRGDPAERMALSMAEGGDAAWQRLVHREVPALRAEGWRVDLTPGFRHRVVEAEGEWEASFGERGGWWFSLELGVEVEGERVPLLPVLAEAVRRLRAGPDGAALLGEDVLYAPLANGRVLALPMGRVRPMLEVLVELYDIDALPKDGRLDVSLGQAAALAAIAAATRLRWLGGERLLGLVERLRLADHVEPLPAPPGFLAGLRPYQEAGLGWLHLLAEHGLGGILADEMGLGKTIQTLAHLLRLKEAGRLASPALIVCPTSLVPNWENETRRFAPGLRVLRLHGPARAGSFERIGEADLVLSTYALLPRDAEALLPVPWSLVVLDEAQAIKNSTAKATQLACRLKAGHRLCLTGTPIENHLGEIYSQFSFLMPGLLGEHARFTRLFRTPIEKRGDAGRARALAARLRPFILRRTKAGVALDLPAKTEIVRRIALTGEQRDLYETVRLAMHERIRREVAERGFERSRIVVLDALLKLRQACCDPRLVKLEAARRVAGSSKLAGLLEMLPELVEGGARILLFSQFTSMLDLIRPELDRLALPFVELRGDTEDRATPVARFQEGEVPIFLVSLKAGGVGLNLTAADTVILYDPWWNPAVEAQATDRAHRIGQQKPVFVYKLIAEGTIEERMLELQERKRALAEQLLGDAEGGFTGFASADLDLLLQPIA